LRSRQRQQHELKRNQGFLGTLERLGFGRSLVRISGHALGDSGIQGYRGAAQRLVQTLVNGCAVLIVRMIFPNRWST